MGVGSSRWEGKAREGGDVEVGFRVVRVRQVVLAVIEIRLDEALGLRRPHLGVPHVRGVSVPSLIELNPEPAREKARQIEHRYSESDLGLGLLTIRKTARTRRRSRQTSLLAQCGLPQ